MRCSLCQKDVGAYYLNDFGAIICNDCGKSYTGRAYSASIKSPYPATTSTTATQNPKCYHCQKEINLPEQWEYISGHKFHKDCVSKEQDLRRNGIKKDAINPSHYTSGGIETIDYLEAKLNRQEYEGFLRGNVLKYVSRYSLKNGVEDLRKAEWYLKRLIGVKENDTVKKTDS